MNYRVLFAILFILLVFFAGYTSVSNASKQAKLDDAKELTSSLKSYFRLIDYRCRARTGEYIGINDCVLDLLKELEVVSDLEESEFRNYNDKKNETGFIIVENKGRNSLESDKFVLLKNRETADAGCVISGAIDPGYTCRLNFNSTCAGGDVLEVKYGETSAHIKTC